ncbi:hypothetical protein [Salibacterium aidingense]|uniref:hypothetical protein n=1 Tax=Salibacterium aidingense TaxID=384933 RepID=UPI0012EB759E|nr:hypothetical protein [Salibacterium aidingense]
MKPQVPSTIHDDIIDGVIFYKNEEDNSERELTTVILDSWKQKYFPDNFFLSVDDISTHFEKTVGPVLLFVWSDHGRYGSIYRYSSTEGKWRALGYSNRDERRSKHPFFN